MKFGKRLAKLWKKKLTKLVVAVALIATGNEFVGVPILKELMTPDQVEKVIEIEESQKTAPVAVLESTSDTAVGAPVPSQPEPETKKEEEK